MVEIGCCSVVIIGSSSFLMASCSLKQSRPELGRLFASSGQKRRDLRRHLENDAAALLHRVATEVAAPERRAIQITLGVNHDVPIGISAVAAGKVLQCRFLVARFLLRQLDYGSITTGSVVCSRAEDIS